MGGRLSRRDASQPVARQRHRLQRGDMSSSSSDDDLDPAATRRARRQQRESLVDVYAVLRHVLMGGAGVQSSEAGSDASDGVDDDDGRSSPQHVLRIDTLQDLLSECGNKRKKCRGHCGAVFARPGTTSDMCHLDEMCKTTISKNLDHYKERLGNLYSSTVNACGLAASQEAPCSLAATLRSRELGTNRWSEAKSNAERCRITNSLLPNVRHKVVHRSAHGHSVDTLRTKTFCCNYLDDGRTLMTASQDRNIRLYGTRGKRQLYRCRRVIPVPEVGWSILDVAVSPDGRNAVYSTWSDRSLLVYQCRLDDGYGALDASGNVQWLTFCVGAPANRFCVFSLRYNSGGNEILCGCAGKTLLVFSRELDKTVLQLAAHSDDVNTVCYLDPSGNVLCSAGDDGLCKLWDRRALAEHRPEPAAVMAGHMDGVTFVDARGDSRYLITNSKDQSIKLWDIRRPATSAGIQATRRAVATQAWDYRWQMPSSYATSVPPLEGDSSVMTFIGHSVHPTLIRCYFSPSHTTGQRYIYTGSGDGQCHLYDILTGQVAARLGGHAGCVRDVAWHPQVNEIVTSSWDGVTACWRYQFTSEQPQSAAASQRQQQLQRGGRTRSRPTATSTSNAVAAATTTRSPDEPSSSSGSVLSTLSQFLGRNKRPRGGNISDD